MLTFLLDNWSYLVAGLVGHVSLSGAGVAFTWAKAEYAKITASGTSTVTALNARIAALESAVAKPVAAPAAPTAPAAH